MIERLAEQPSPRSGEIPVAVQQELVALPLVKGANGCHAHLLHKRWLQDVAGYFRPYRRRDRRRSR
ncbi:hypothetical protein, partial [Sinorhizobium medicae]|uniref:hypothetical protein n=1 Tax=Sinorhizobium medicae TaxID=110321 RepID=UPI001AECCE78